MRMEYTKPKTKLERITDDASGYLTGRGISKETQKAWKVCADGGGNIVFPYFDEQGQHVFNKFRSTREKKMWRESGTKPILYGMDKCNPEKPLVIVEGEIDCLSLAEAGIKNVTSVPSGTQDLTWLTTCWGFLEKFKKIILWVDNDEPGKELERKLIKKLGEYRCYT